MSSVPQPSRDPEDNVEGEEVFESEEDELPFQEPLNKEDFIGNHNNPIYAQIDFQKRRKKPKRWIYNIILMCSFLLT